MNAPSPNTARPCSLLRLALAAAVGAFLFWFVQFNVEWQMEYRRQKEIRSVVEPTGDAWMLCKVLGFRKSEGMRVERIVVPSRRFPRSVAILFEDVNGVMSTVVAENGWRHIIHQAGSDQHINYEGAERVLWSPTDLWVMMVTDGAADYYRRWMPIRRKFVDRNSGEWAMEDTSVPLTLIQLPDDAQANQWCLFFDSMLYSEEWYETRGAGTGEP